MVEVVTPIREEASSPEWVGANSATPMVGARTPQMENVPTKGMVIEAYVPIVAMEAVEALIRPKVLPKAKDEFLAPIKLEILPEGIEEELPEILLKAVAPVKPKVLPKVEGEIQEVLTNVDIGPLINLK